MIETFEKLALSCTFRVVDGTLTETQEPEALPGRELEQGLVVDGKYKVVGLLGRGGMGAVYRVHHEHLLKSMALKTLNQQNLSGDSLNRFQLEAKAIAKLRHKNIVEVFDFGVASQEFSYYTMELLEGESLAERLKRSGPEEITSAINIFMSVADALAHAHRQQIVHRDIKPGNIYLCQSAPVTNAWPLVKIVDFGIAKLITDNSSEAQSTTIAGVIFGSPLYMSPEQSMGQAVDGRTDIYSFGCALFEVLTGRPPFVGENCFATTLAHSTSERPRLSAVKPDKVFSERLESVIAKLLAKEPQRRYQNFDEVKEALSLCLTTPAQVHAGKNQGDTAYDGGGVHQPGESEAVAAASAGSGRTNMAALLCALIVGASALWLVCTLAWQSEAAKKEEQRIARHKREKQALAEEESIRQGKKTDKLAKEEMGDFTLTFNSLNQYPIRFDKRRGTKTILFPDRLNQAEILIDGEATTKKWCIGPFEAPAAARLFLICDDGMKPEFLQNFRANDLYGVSFGFAGESEWSEQHFQALSHLTGLRKCVLNNCTLNQKSFSYVLKLENLFELRLHNTNLTGEQLAQTLELPDLIYLDAGGWHKDMVRLLENLRSARKLEFLLVCNAGLKDEDMKWIAEMPRLRQLSLDANPITNRGLETLAARPELIGLSLKQVNLDPSCIEILARFHQLRALNMCESNWSPADRRRLQEALPRCEIRWSPKDNVLVPGTQ